MENMVHAVHVNGMLTFNGWGVFAKTTPIRIDMFHHRIKGSISRKVQNFKDYLCFHNSKTFQTCAVVFMKLR